MNDKEAILSIINANFDICADVYERRHELKCINFCTSCDLRDIESEYPCWQHRIADMLLMAIPQFDICKEKKVICRPAKSRR